MDLIAELAKHGKRLEDIVQIYHGKDNACRCGCKGRYFNNTAIGYVRALTAIQKPDFKPLKAGDVMHAWDGDVITDGVHFAGDNLNIPYDAEHDKCYCLYFKQR